MGPEAEEIFASFTFTAAADKDDPDIVMGKFDAHFVPKRNVIFERAKYKRRSQTDGESIEAYVRSLFVMSVIILVFKL